MEEDAEWIDLGTRASAHLHRTMESSRLAHHDHAYAGNIIFWLRVIGFGCSAGLATEEIQRCVRSPDAWIWCFQGGRGS